MGTIHELGTISPNFPSNLVEKYSEKISELNVYTESSDSGTYLYVKDGCENWYELASLIQQMLTDWTVDNPETAPKYAYIKACYYCDKMRADEFGGFAVFITLNDITKKSWTTLLMAIESWVQEQIGTMEEGKL